MIEEITKEEKDKQEKQKFYTLKSDIIFKNTFDTKERLKRLLEETLDLKVHDIFKSNIEMPVENVSERRKHLDLILETDKGIINVELNHNYEEEIPIRNFLYFCKMISSSVRRSKSYAKIDKHIQLNITWNLQKYFDFDITNRKIIKCCLMDKKAHHKVHADIFEICHINMDYYEKVWYDGNIKEENPFLMFLAAPNEEKMDLICRGDKGMESLNKKVKKLNQDPNIIDVIIENEEEILNNTRYDFGVKAGISQGITQGIEQNKIEIARRMLEENFNIKDISKITGLTEKEIEDLK